MKRGSFEAAVECIAAQQRNNTYRGAIIGRMRSDYDACFYKSGDYVLVTPYGDEGKCTIERPMLPVEISKQRERGSLLTTWIPVVCYPISGIDFMEE